MSFVIEKESCFPCRHLLERLNDAAPSPSWHDLRSRPSGPKGFSERLEKFLEVEKDYVDGSLVVAINGKFGSGKSTLIEMWNNDIAQRRDGGEWSPMPVILNAWESDHCGDPMIAILSGLIEAADKWRKPAETQTGKLKEAAKTVAWFTVAMLNGITSKVGSMRSRQGKSPKRKLRNPQSRISSKLSAKGWRRCKLSSSDLENPSAAR